MASRQALGRVGIGAAMLVAPGLVARSWVGEPGGEPGARVITTAVGARDLAIGLGVLRALRGGGKPGPWLRAGAFADAADLVATVRARRDLPLPAVIGVGALAAGSVALGMLAERALGAQPSP